MQTKEKCIKCTKGVVCGWNSCGKPVFGCQSAICIFDEIVENPYREAYIKELSNGGKNFRR